MTTLLLIGGIWTLLALVACIGLGLVAARPAPRVEAVEDLRPLLGHAQPDNGVSYPSPTVATQLRASAQEKQPALAMAS